MRRHPFRTLLIAAALAAALFTAHTLGLGAGIGERLESHFPQLFGVEHTDSSSSYARLKSPGGDELAWDACQPVRFLANLDSAPDYVTEQFVKDALDTLAIATGREIIYDGLTSATKPADGSPWGAKQFGDYPQWAPVLLEWVDPDHPQLGNTDGHVAGRAYNTYATVKGKHQVVSGSITMSNKPGVSDPAYARVALLHELGHIMGLDHVGDAQQVMFSSPHAGREYNDGDLAGFAAATGECGTQPRPKWAK